MSASTITLQHFENRDLIAGYYHYWTLEDFTHDPYTTTYHGQESWILPEGVSVGQCQSGEPDLFRGPDNLTRGGVVYATQHKKPTPGLWLDSERPVALTQAA